MRLIKISFLLFSAALLSACASTVQLSEQERTRILSIKISDQVRMPEEAAYVGGGAAFGAIGALLQGNSQSDKIKNYLNQNKIDVGQIVYEQFGAAAQKSSFLASRLNTAGTTVIELEVRMYGIGLKHGLSDQFKPMLSYYARMKNPDGSIIWEQYEYTSFDTLPTYTLEQYFSEPKYFREAFSEAAKVLADRLMAKV